MDTTILVENIADIAKYVCFNLLLNFSYFVYLKNFSIPINIVIKKIIFNRLNKKYLGNKDIIFIPNMEITVNTNPSFDFLPTNLFGAFI